MRFDESGFGDILEPLSLSKQLVQLFELHLNADGVPLSGRLRTQLEAKAASIEADVRGRIGSKGVPRKFTRLFELSQRAAVERYCRDLAVYPEDIAYLICNCGQVGYLHSLVDADTAPAVVRPPLVRGMEKVLEGSPSKGRDVRKLLQRALRSRRYRQGSPVGHLFERGEEWHWLRIPTSWHRLDLERYWARRPHMEYLGHLWAELKREDLPRFLSALRSRRHRGVHIELSLRR